MYVDWWPYLMSHRYEILSLYIGINIRSNIYTGWSILILICLWFSCSRWSILICSSVVDASWLMDWPFIKKTQHETHTRNYESKMMHDMFMQKWDFFFLKGLSKLIVNIVEEHGFICKLKRYCNRFLFQKVRTKPRKKILNKRKA